ncbi:protein mesh-like [Daphnia carinata]|uniref:protein mesh-like n=1 Tax=Daphnia carinata TaxID=120202 RepID=UPI002868B753|nr:protein mesh-like [Daphnia carinata]
MDNRCKIFVFVALAACLLTANASEQEGPCEDDFDIESAKINNDLMTSRLAPSRVERQLQLNDPAYQPQQSYDLKKEELDEIRKENMYPYYDKDANGENGDRVREINDNSAQVQKQLNFWLPFSGSKFDSIWISIHGFLSFSDPMGSPPLPPLQFPVQTWPVDNGPSFISPFYSRWRIGRAKESDQDKRAPGVYFRLERDLPARFDESGVKLRERIKWDIREAFSEPNFFPKHAIIATWKNVSFVGGFNALEITNTFQAVIVTDEVVTYAMFNYAHLGWTTHAEAGGDTNTGQGGVPAFVGFNAGNGTKAYEYKGYANRIPGRHVFRIDRRDMSGNFFDDETFQNVYADIFIWIAFIAAVAYCFLLFTCILDMLWKLMSKMMSKMILFYRHCRGQLGSYNVANSPHSLNDTSLYVLSISAKGSAPAHVESGSKTKESDSTSPFSSEIGSIRSSPPDKGRETNASIISTFDRGSNQGSTSSAVKVSPTES